MGATCARRSAAAAQLLLALHSAQKEAARDR